MTATARQLLPVEDDKRNEARYQIGHHKIIAQRKTREKVDRHFVSGVAWCTCGWSSPTHSSNAALFADIWAHAT